MPESNIDFLFEGKPPQSVTTYGQTVENIPKWMSDYTQGLIARANAAAAEPYIPYGGPRIAGFDPAQEEAFSMTEENVGAWRPHAEAAGQGYAGGLDAAANISAAAQPYMDEASGRWTDPGVAESYMNPYIGGVLDRQEQLATRTLEKDFLPSLQRAFTGAGSFGSRGGTGSMENIGIRGVQDIQEGLEAQRLEALSGAYGMGADIYGSDQARYADLGRLAGTLQEAEAGSLYQGAEGVGRLGEFVQRAGLTDAASMEAVGAQRRGLEQGSLDLAYQDFLEQRNLPFERTAFMNEMIRGLPYSRATQRTDVGPASVYQPSPLSQMVGGYGVYRGLTQEAEGGYIEPEQEFGIGGLATAAWEGMYNLGKADGAD